MPGIFLRVEGGGERPSHMADNHTALSEHSRPVTRIASFFNYHFLHSETFWENTFLFYLHGKRGPSVREQLVKLVLHLIVKTFTINCFRMLLKVSYDKYVNGQTRSDILCYITAHESFLFTWSCTKFNIRTGYNIYCLFQSTIYSLYS
jgi:hypothetical protein